jgi:hypothetical protein
MRENESNMGEAKRRKKIDPNYGKSKRFSNKLAFFSKKIDESASLNEVEQSFSDLISHFPICIEDIKEAYLKAAKSFAEPCVLVVPSKEISLDIVAANFQVLCQMNNDINARQMYDQRKNNYIPCYLHSIDILAQKTETTPKDYEFRLLMLLTADAG